MAISGWSLNESKYLSTSEVLKLLDTVRRRSKEASKLNDKAAIMDYLALCTGLRSGCIVEIFE